MINRHVMGERVEGHYQVEWGFRPNPLNDGLCNVRACAVAIPGLEAELAALIATEAET